ncbi:MAG: heparinase II/III family protein [Candidatus Brocadiia bacterium]
MSTPMLANHPRLYVTDDQLARLARNPELPVLRQLQSRLAEETDQYVRGPADVALKGGHNAHLVRARRMQRRVVSLITRWRQTGEVRFRRAALDHIRTMAGWDYWSWIAWRRNDSRPEAIFDLSYGENSATLAVAFDWLFDSLSNDERDTLVATARDRALGPFLHHVRKGQPPGWFGREDSNWNAVCAGGAGLLALSLHDELPEARQARPLVEESLEPFMRSLAETDGGWTEGIGYWNYGMRYALMYLLSHERATGREHPLLRQEETRKSLSFAPDFCPRGVPCSFGDSNHWFPLPIHYAATERLDVPDVEYRLHRRLTEGEGGGGSWPNAAEWLLLHPRSQPAPPEPEEQVVRLYRGMDWGFIADRMPEPDLYLAVRGGTTEVPHGHRDLLSFHCVVDGEAVVTNVGVGEYLDTTFSPRRWELFETMPPSKNTILINGVGITKPAAANSEALRRAGMVGIRMEATEAMGESRDGPAAEFCGRLFLMLDARGFLILDRVVLPFEGRVESRMHTYAEVELRKAGATLDRNGVRVAVSYGCDVPASRHLAVSAPTTPRNPSAMLRWCTDELRREVTMATLLCRGARGRVRVDSTDDTITVRCSAPGWQRDVRLTGHLRIARSPD